MSDREKPLPKPPASPFGRKRRLEQGEEEGSLMADRIATAAAEGKLEEFVKSEIPDSEHARKLVSMMMGMAGIAPMEMLKSSEEEPSPGPGPDDPSTMPPEDVLKAVHAGDVQGLKGLLERERRKRSPEAGAAEDQQDATEKQAEGKVSASVEKETIDLLIRIASENDVSPDWIILRALRLYIREYQKTGRL